ncbi:secretory carrier-associated membrane protein 1 isoform X1 [Halyomorpha halys]|uniref:secretory carrier-associated membrane protein 1 isoform X1 n=1 Tax=Halyomorpha halys TaxID=286706 RepID=UPI0006D4DD7B|nr:secretory carrier-associated membrane protein 1 isoform X3 [Halyomorpha halys]
MSGFDDVVNPFSPPTVDNPFADPAVQQVTKQTSSVQRGLEEYNPFADQPSPPAVNAIRTGGERKEPAVMPATQEPPPPYTRTTAAAPPPNAAANMTPADFQRRQEELERKAAELQRREEELRNNTYNVRKNNWPPLPSNSCGLEPCFYQDINVDIPVDFQSVVRQMYNLWIFHFLLLLANMFVALIRVITFGDFETFGLSLLYTVILTPFSFVCWYRPGYKAFRDDSSFSFMVFFFIFAFQMLVTAVMAIGMTGGGSCGLYKTIKTFEYGNASGIIVGLLMLSVTLGFITAVLLDFVLISKVHRIYRSSGASMAKARAEFTTEIMKNEHVRGAASTAATAAVQSQFNQPSRSGGFP